MYRLLLQVSQIKLILALNDICLLCKVRLVSAMSPSNIAVLMFNLDFDDPQGDAEFILAEDTFVYQIEEVQDVEKLLSEVSIEGIDLEAPELGIEVSGKFLP